MWRRWLFLKRHRCSTPAEKQYHLEDVIMLCFVFISFTLFLLLEITVIITELVKKALINLTVIIIRVIVDKVDQYMF